MDSNEAILNDFLEKHPFAAAKALQDLNHLEMADFLQKIPLHDALKLMGLMDSENVVSSFSSFSEQKKGDLIEYGEVELVASLLRKLGEPLTTNLLSSIPSAKSSLIKRKISFDPNTVGAEVSQPIVVNREMNVSSATELLKEKRTSDDIYLFVLNLDGMFQGLVRPRELLFANGDVVIEDVMLTDGPKFLPDTLIANILDHPAWLEFLHIPVVEKSGRFIGSISRRRMTELNQRQKEPGHVELLETGNALGELYRIGLTGLFRSAAK